MSPKDPAKNPDNCPGSIGQALEYCSSALEDSDAWYGHGTDNAWDEAVQLVLAMADLPADSDTTVLELPVTPETFGKIETLLRKRISSRTPLPYLLGRAYFAGLEFKCDERAIIPRSPVAELILDEFRPWYCGPAPTRVLDMCCGGGSIGLSVAHYFPDVTVDLLDVDEQALSLATQNSEFRELGHRVRILQSNGFAALHNEKYDLILCNPPYVDQQELAAMPQEYHWEPELALGSGVDGLDFTRKFLAGVGRFLKPEGMLVLEVGASWPALEKAYPEVAFTRVELEQGGEGVFVMSAREWQDYSESFLQ